MSSSFAALDQFDVRNLASAIAQNTGADGLNLMLAPAQWDTLASYMQPFTVQPGHVLMSEGDHDRMVYLVERGSLSVHREDEKSRIRLAMVGAGSVVGEGGFFAHVPRNATVQAAGPSVLWRLNPIRYSELANRQPAIALQFVTALAGVLAKRLRDAPRRIAAT